MIQKIKNSWLYEKLNNLQNEDAPVDYNKHLSLKIIYNFVVTPVFGILMAFLGLIIILLLPLGILKDIFDWYYNKHAERLKKEAEIKAKIETDKKIKVWLNKYQKSLDYLEDTYCLKEKRIVEDPPAASKLNDIEESIIEPVFKTI